MTWTGWLVFGLVAAGIIALLLTTEVREQQALRRRINAALAEQRCRQCGGRFWTWRGSRSHSHAIGLDEEFIDAVSITCGQCGLAADAFWSDDHAKLWLD